uniref:Inner membrane protein n=1 Tax=Mesocestoides corti TaxID=53468 RepID=A0A5K3EJ79_MESCO
MALKTIETISDKNAIEKQFDDIITRSVNEMLNSVLDTYTNAVDKMITTILPCGGLHYVVKAAVYTGCSDTGLIPRFFGWALSLALVTLFSFLSYVGVYNLWCIQSRQIKRRYR